jgi:hypothetical protein
MTEDDSTAPPEVVSDAPATPAVPVTQTAQIPVNEPLPTQLEPIDSAQDKPTPPPAQPQTTSIVHTARDLLVKARATIQFRKTAKLEKIMSALQKKNHITNDEVEKLLHVSDATATRYLSALEKQGRIKQIGKSGKAVTYTKP